MTRKSKIIYIVGSVVIGIASVLIILFGLILGGVITLGDSKLVISSASREFTYNGEEQTDGGWQLVSGKLAKGHTIEASVTGSREDVGSSLNYITVTIVDSNGADVTSDYAIEYRVGTLTVIARPITIKTAEVEKTYDGEELTSPDWEITKGKLVAGQTMSVTMNASITDAGEVENSAEVEIFAGEKDVTSNYAITKDTGVLKVNPIEFHFVTPTLTKTYDGLPLFSAPDSFELISGAPLAGHSVVSMKVVGRITNVGEVENSVEIKIAAANGTDITKNYLAVIDSGTLTVRGIAITISTASGEKVYDGTPLANPEWALNAGTPLLAGHEITQLIMPASQTNAGISPNEISQITIVNSLGEDVTENYEINYSIGSLVVTPRPITVQSGSASKEYDGRPLTCREWKFTSNYLPVSGQSADVAISGSRTEPGQTANTIAQVIISDKNGNDLTGNYDITRDEGVLIVKGEGSPANVGDLDQSGNISGGETGDSDAPETTALGVKTQSGGTVYLRLTSFGNYDGKKWSKAKEYSKTYSGNSFNYLAADSLKNEGYTAENISIAVYGTGYYLPYYMTVNGDYTVQKSDVYNAGNSKNYSLEYYRYNYISNPLEGKLTGSAVSGYTSFVHTNYTAVTSGTKAYLDKIISEQGWKSGDKDLIKKVASYVQNSAEYNLEYDRALDNENDIVLAFLRDYKEGICQHYASAATLLYRQLGLPARYTIGYVADTVADDWVEVKAKNAHAWVEVYIDGFGWVQVEVTGGSSAGGAFEGDGNGNQGGENGENGGEQNGVISVKPVTEYYKYDGRTSFRHSGSLQGLSYYTLQGFTYKAEVYGSFKSPGKYSVTVQSFAFFDPYGRDVTADYKFCFKEGTLQVYQYEITVSTGGDTKTYDGSEIKSSDCGISKGHLAEGHTLAYLYTTASRTKVGVSINSYEIKIVDAGGVDVSYKYKINSSYGLLTVTAREITVTAGSDEKIYDGTPLTCGDYEINGSLAAGHREEVTVKGSFGGKAGSAENKIDKVIIYDAEGLDVTSNYKITTVNGKLTVKPE